MKVGVLVVAFNAESTLTDVLNRIPGPVQLELAEILVQDDHSHDATFDVASQYVSGVDGPPLTVVRHPRNLGYGGNQKVGYTYAIQHGWDVVVLLHGDGQYAPELIGELIRPITAGEADAVLGSRMMHPGAARAGGMPLYKRVGNRVLSRFQNALASAHLSEWHSGYRAYRVSTLAELPFVGNNDGFDFDTQIILQLLDAGARITEVPIPTYYGDEICYVNGVSYARDVVADTVRFRLGRTGFGGGRLGSVQEGYAFKSSPHSSHRRVLQLAQDCDPGRVLDLGCGSGAIALALTEAGHRVTAVDSVIPDGLEARIHRAIPANLDDGLPDDVGDGFDTIIAADVIEHLRNPEHLLAQLPQRLRAAGRILVSVPNFGHWYARGRAVSGTFDYDQRGILDRTHLRFFTRRSFLRMAADAGLQPVRHRHVGVPLDVLGLADRSIGAGIGAIDRSLVRLWPTLFAYQLVFELAPWRGGSLTDEALAGEP